jgi:hypothetical protein
MPKSPFVRPDQAAAPPLAHAEEVLVGRGMAAPIAHPVAELFLVALEQLAGSEVTVDVDELESLLEHLADHVRDVGGDQPTEEIALLTATRFLAFAAFNHTIWHGDPRALIARMMAHLAQRHRDYSGALALILGSKKDAADELLRSGLVAALLERELVDPCRFLDADKIRKTTKGVPGGGNWNQHERDRTPALPDFWVGVDPERAMRSFVSMLGEEPAATLGALAIGLERCLGLRYFGQAGGLYRLLVPIAETLCRRRRTEGRENDVLLTRCCWAYGRWALEAMPECLVEDRGPLRALALAELGRMRGWLRDNSGDGAERFAEHEDYLHTGLFFVLRTDPKSLWDVLRRLLLAMRELAHRAVPLDLRSWDEGELEPIPRPWGWVPDHLARALEFFLGRELERDPMLEELRGKIAQFCLDRLKTGKKVAVDMAVTEDDLVEPDPIWRLGYLHAVRELHVNPGGRGHNVLAWSQRRDPSELVRDEAKLAHEALRRGHKLPPGVSPRRAVYAAMWWLKQAHVVALGDQPEKTGALRTYRKEARRARELDEQLT